MGTTTNSGIKATRTYDSKAKKYVVSLDGGNGIDLIDAAAEYLKLGAKSTDTFVIVAGNGDDDVRGSDYAETIWGDSNTIGDTLGNGADKLHGGGGNDEIHGGNGADSIWGDAGGDILYGDRGGDEFKYNGVGDSAANNGAWSAPTGDWIKDFSKAEKDLLDLSAFNDLTKGKLQFSSGPSSLGVWIGADVPGTKIVYVDVTGDGVADVAIKVTGDVDFESIKGVNDAAVITGTSTASLTETDAVQTTGGTLSATDVDSSNAFQAQSNVAGSNKYGTFSIGADGKWTYTMNSAHNEFVAGQSYVDSITVKTADGTTQVLKVTINGTNDAAVITGTSTASLTETDAVQTTGGTLSATDVDSSNAFQAQSNVAGSNKYGTFSIGADGKWTYTMNSAHNEFQGGKNYTDSVIVKTADGTTQVLTVTINGTNDASVLTGTPATLAAGTEDTAYTVSAADLLQGFSDVDGDTLSVNGLGADHGTVKDNGDGTFTITPAANYNGPVALSYSVVDGHGGSVAASQSFVLAAVNDAPTGTASAELTGGTEDTAYTVSAADLLQGFSDVDGDTLSVNGLGADHGTVKDNGDGTFTITPAANYNGPVALSYSVVDGHGGSVAASQSFVLAAVNDAPTTSPVTLAAIAEDSGARIITQAELLGNAVDLEGNPLTASNLQMTAGGKGTLVANSDGTWTYTPASNDDTSVSFSYTVSDGDKTAAGSASLDITPVNDAPNIEVRVGDASSVILTETNSGLTSSGKLTVTDADGPDTVSTAISSVVVNGNAGSLTNTQLIQMLSLAPNSSLPANVGDVNNLTWTFNSGNEAFNFLGAGQTLQLTYNLTSNDGNGGSDTQAVVVTITGTNDAGTDLTFTYTGQPGNSLPNGAFGQISAVDPDGGGSTTYSMTGLSATVRSTGSAAPATGNDGYTGDISISSSGVISASGLNDNRNYQVTFTATQNGNTFSEIFHVITGTNAIENIGGPSTTGDDVIFAQGDSDIILAGSGNDTVFGQAGADQIHGGSGIDVLFGGGGDDAFYFESALNSLTNVDTIKDFDVGGGTDKIALDDAIFSAFTGQTALSQGQFVSNANGTAVGTGSQIIYNSSTGALYYDADGAGNAYEAVQFATLTLGKDGFTGTLNASDFFIV